MTKFVISVILLRFILPGVLLLALALRPFGISVFYLLLYLLLPHAPVPSNGRFAGTSASKVVLLVLLTSVALLLVHVAWHVFLLALPPYGSALGDTPCQLLETIALNLGFVSYKNIDIVPAVIRILPEVIMSVVSIIMYPVLKKLCTDPSISYVPKPESKNQQYPFLTNAGKYISLLLIMATGVVRPSATSGVYFLCFLGCGTWWACGRELERAYAIVARVVAAVMVGHILVLFAYQCTWILDMLPNSSPYSRYFGLTQIVKMDCNHTTEFRYVDTEWATFAYPIMILVTYYILVLETRELLKPKVACPYIDTKRPYRSPNESTPLIKGIKSSTKFVNIRRDTRVLHQDSTGSVIVPDEDTEDQDEPGLLDEVILAIIGFFQVLIRSSYIATSITMMAWSIMYHSWLTFVLLIWANIVWLVHNQRGFMLKTSPLLVAYAILLLLSQYIYGMNLTEAELPATVKGINLSQIGFERPKDLPCVPLLIKSMFMIMFWVTLRQKNQEERQRRHSSALADMVAPLHLTVGTAATVLDEPEYGESILLKKFGEWLKQFCTKFWIYIVVIMLFIIGITGERMTIFRIVYMFLFLFFILLFQTSYKLWRKMLYPFWIVLIVYSMINLVLVYIYQFDNFAQMVEEHLMIPQSLQYDLGLEKFVTSQLFLRLFTPTLFLIITIIQVHYFHKEFLEFSKLKSRTSSLAPAGDGPSPSHLSTIKDDISRISSEEVITVEHPHKQSFATTEGTDIEGARSSGALEQRRSLLRRVGAPSDRSLTDPTSAHTDTFRQWLRRLLDSCRDKYESLMDLIFLYLEIHLIKIIFVSLMFLCVFDVCALHVPIMIAISVALLMSSRHQNWCLVIVSIMLNIYLMAKMIYQIKYIQHEIFDVNCTVSSNITIRRNGAEWVGFVKATHEKSLASILKGYIGLIAIFTFQSVVTYRQQRFRESGSSSRSIYRAKTVFPGIDRQKADCDLIHCLKYLVNYGFYKFGIEITLICLIGVIGSRMDLYAVLYAVWLFVLVASCRERQACLWPFFTAFVAVMVPLQYVLAVGEVPEFCIQYPWSSPTHHNLRKWLYLPDAQNPPHATKLIFDYFLLLLCARQRRVFHLERRYGDVYPGGSNKEDIGTDWETPSFINPVPDFLSIISSWLDIIKRFVFLGMLWVTLAIMFLTGTNRVNLFSMGYLIGSFIFLWQGTDFYLRPKSAILKWWSWLLRYNVGVIVVKVILQIPGCLFIDTLQEDACWFVQLFGIGCIDKFSGGSVKKFFKMDIIDQHECAVPREDIGLAWDGVCFAFLLLQRRLFYSYYFYRIIDESKASAILASRGAELIDEIRERQMQQQDEQEKKILEKIKIKMERIKANQKKLQVSLRAHHDAASVSSRAVYWKHEPKTHQQAVRSGDYYMFDEFDELEDVDAKDNELTSSDDEVAKEMGLGELLTTVIKTDIKQAVSLRRASAPAISRASRQHTSPASPVSEPLRAPTALNVEQPTPRPEIAGRQEMVDILRPRRSADLPNEQSEYLYPPEEDNLFDKIKQYLQFGWAFVDSFFISVTRYIKRYSRDYRYVSKVLFNEKKILKEKEGFGVGIRTGKDMIWQPAPGVSLQRHHNTTLDEQDDTMFRKDKPPIVHFLFAIWYAILAHTDIVCYIMVFVNQIQSATILSIPLPLMVFLWGTLTIPRPTKTFWITLIAYTEVIVLIKSMFQFEILPWNQKLIPANTPFTAPRIIGVERKVNYALYDLLLLLVIFFHRAMLKSLGLWTTVTKDSEHEREIGETNFTALMEPEQGPSHEPVQYPEADKTMLIQKCDDSCPKQLEIAEISDEFDQEEDEKYQRYLRMALMRYCHPVKKFYQRMLDPTARVTADVYAYMFMCDFFNFLVVIFGFAAFGTHQGDGGVQAYLEENKVPIPFLVMLILQFALIIIDRALYLRKFILGKILFQIVLIIGVHIWMFFVLPFITERTFNTLLPPPMWYMIKCIYLLLSAYQIRCGYPTRILGNFLCKGYNFFNMIFFKAFMIVPFVFELRTLMDWIWTDTSMTFMDWLKMEDIFANVFLLKCSRHTEDEFPQERGVKKKVVSKYLLGGTVLALIIALIWFPLVLFAFGNSVGVSNLPYDVTARIRIGPFLATYQMSAQSHNIEAFTESDYDTLSNVYMKDRTAQTFLSNYLFDDVGVVSLNSDSTSVWDISPPDLKRLQEEAQSNSTLLVKFTYVISHSTNSKDNPPTIEEEKEVKLKPFLEGTTKRNPQRDILYNMLAGETKDWLTVEHLFPKFLKVFNKGTAKPVHQLMVKVDDDEDNMYRNVQMKLLTLNGLKWWQVRESCTDLNYETFLHRLPKNNCEKLVLYTFNDKLFPETLNFISGSGIIGLYTTFVFLASRVLRNFFSGICFKIMFEDLPNVDRVLQMCLDIYLVREADEMALEEDLFAKLVFLYRSPETMIKWTRPREDANVDNVRDEEMPGRNPN